MADFNKKLNDLNDTPDTTAQFDPSDIEQNKLMAVLAYISWLVLIPIFAAKESKFARYHANQGIVLAIAELVAIVALNVLSGLPLIGWLFSIVSSLFGLVCCIMAVIGILNAVNGRAKELPVVGKFRILK